MKKLNIVFSFTAFAFLLISPFLTGCAEGERELMFPDRDLPESVTITVEAPAEAAFKMVISTDYKTEKDNLATKSSSPMTKRNTLLQRISTKLFY